MNESIKQGKLLINYLLYFITFISLCFIGIGQTLATTYIEIGSVKNKTTVAVGVDYNSSPIIVPADSSYNFHSVTDIYYMIDNYTFDANKHYQLESHLSNQTLTNANSYTVQGLNGEQCLTSYTDSIFTGTYPRWDFQCPHATTSITLTISNNARQYLWPQATTNIFTWTSSLLKYSTESISSSSSSNNQDIINNQNQNTNNIINNQNQNTQEIIDNQNQNTQDIIDSNEVCTDYDKSSIVTDNYYLDTGVQVSNSTYGITDYINVTKASIKVITDTMGANPSVCFYDTNKTYISCVKNSTLSLNYEIPIPSNATYVRFSIHKSSNRPQFRVCQSGNQALNDSVNNLTGALTDDSPIDIDSLGNTAGWLPAGPIDSIINLPLNLFNNLLTALNGTCQPLNIPLPYVNRTLPIPCINTIFNQINGLPNFWNWVGVITSIVILYRYLINLYKYYDDLTTMKANFISDFGGAP